MKQLPSFAAGSVGEHETVVFWTRRATYEIVEEWADGLFFIWLWSGFLFSIAEQTENYTILFGLLFNIFAVIYIAYEMLLWSREVYVVSEFDHDKGGTLYKFTLTKKLSVKEQAIPINASFGGLTTDRPWHMILWGDITGEKMERIHITAGGAGFINGARLPVQLVRSIYVVKGSPPNKALEADPNAVKYCREIRAAMMSGAIDPWYGEMLLHRIYDSVLDGSWQYLEANNA